MTLDLEALSSSRVLELESLRPLVLIIIMTRLFTRKGAERCVVLVL